MMRAIGEGDGSGAIPRFHQATMKFVERLFLVAHRFVIRPRFRDHHHDRVRQGTAREHERFQAVVEHRGVAAVGIDDREDFLDVVAEKVAFEKRFARVHPVDVAAQGVDFAVVRDEAIGMRPLPAREGVGAEKREWTSARAVSTSLSARSG